MGNASLAAGAGSVAEAGLSTAANIAGAASGIASFASAALPGIGIAVQAITSIFQHHAQAVYTEQQTLCRIAGVVNQVIPYYDAQVRSGQVSPSTAYQGIQTFMAQVNAGLSTIEKQCNAACVYAGIFAAHADFAQSYYPAIAPVQFGAHAPGGAPAVYGTVPGGVIQVGSAVSSALSQSLAAIPSSAKGILLALGVAVAASLIVAVTVKS